MVLDLKIALEIMHSQNLYARGEDSLVIQFLSNQLILFLGPL